MNSVSTKQNKAKHQKSNTQYKSIQHKFEMPDSLTKNNSIVYQTSTKIRNAKHSNHVSRLYKHYTNSSSQYSIHNSKSLSPTSVKQTHLEYAIHTYCLPNGLQTNRASKKEEAKQNCKIGQQTVIKKQGFTGKKLIRRRNLSSYKGAIKTKLNKSNLIYNFPINYSGYFTNAGSLYKEELLERHSIGNSQEAKRQVSSRLSINSYRPSTIKTKLFTLSESKDIPSAKPPIGLYIPNDCYSEIQMAQNSRYHTEHHSFAK